MRFWLDAESSSRDSSPAIHVTCAVGISRSIHLWAREENPAVKDNNDGCKTGNYDRTPASGEKGFGKGFGKHFGKHFGNGFEIEIAKSCGIRAGKRFGKVSEKGLNEIVEEVFGNGRCKEERIHKA